MPGQHLHEGNRTAGKHVFIGLLFWRELLCLVLQILQDHFQGEVQAVFPVVLQKGVPLRGKLDDFYQDQEVAAQDQLSFPDPDIL